VEAAKVLKENIVAAEKNEEGKAQNKEREGEEGRVLVLVADILGFPVSSSSSQTVRSSFVARNLQGETEETERSLSGHIRHTETEERVGRAREREDTDCTKCAEEVRWRQSIGVRRREEDGAKGWRIRRCIKKLGGQRATARASARN
jgi:hypothetical protein